MSEQTADANYEGVWRNRIGFGKKAALLACARQQGIAVVHANIRYHHGHFADGGIWVKKAPVMKDMVKGNPLAAFCTQVPHAQGIDTVAFPVARELAPAGVRSAPRCFGAASQHSGSKLPRHRKCEF